MTASFFEQVYQVSLTPAADITASVVASGAAVEVGGPRIVGRKLYQ